MELFRALAALAEPPGPEQARLGAVLGLPGAPDPAEYTEVFIFELCPYAAVYLGPEGMLGGEAEDRVAGFWRALHRVPPAEPDHLTILLALYAALAEGEASEPDPGQRLLWGQSRKALLWEHLVSWLFPYLDKLREIAPPFYRAWGDLLAEALVRETRVVGAQDLLPLHLRQAPPLPDPRTANPEEFLQGLLAPVRSGIVLVRADLARAARALGLGRRLGERRFMLTSFLAQDPKATLGWLSTEARGWIGKHLGRGASLDAVARFWAERAEATAALLDELQGDTPGHAAACRLSLHGAEGEAGHNVALDDQGEHDDRQCDHRRGGGERSPVDLLKADHVEDRDGQGAGVTSGQDHREQKVVPGEDEADDRRGHDPRPDQREHHAPERAEV